MTLLWNTAVYVLFLRIICMIIITVSRPIIKIHELSILWRQMASPKITIEPHTSSKMWKQEKFKWNCHGILTKT